MKSMNTQYTEIFENLMVQKFYLEFPCHTYIYLHLFIFILFYLFIFTVFAHI